MAYSTVEINFSVIPPVDSVLNLVETHLGLNLNEIFKASRQTAGQVRIPNFVAGHDEVIIPPGGHGDPDDPGQIIEATEDHYNGYTPTYYKTAFDLDYNATGLFTVIATNDANQQGGGTVTITATYPNAVFVLGTNTSFAEIIIHNEGYIPPETPFSFTPSSMAFVHKQNDPRQFQLITMTGNSWKIVAKPNFILGSSTPGVAIVSNTDSSGTYFFAYGSGNATVGVGLSEYYDSEAVFTPSDLAGTFNILKDNVQFGTINYTVSVTRLSDFFQVPYPSGQKAFTLDTKYFELKSPNSDTYFQFDAEIKTYDFFTNVVTENIIPQKVVLFKGKSKINLGQIIHRLMRKFPEVNENLLQYQFAKLKVSCAEKLISNDTVVRSGTSAEIQFVAGLSRGITDFGFLEFNPKPNRVTKKSFAFLNMLIPSGNYELRTFKNGTLFNTETLPINPTTTLCKKVLFNSFTKGDVIDYVIDLVGQNNNNAPKKTFCLFPDGNYSNMLVWENEFKMQSAIECTGTASLDTDFEFQNQKRFELLVEKTENLSTGKDVKLSIDTGWLMKSDTDTVESLMRSKRIWLIQENTTISLRPLTKKIPNDDYEKELISFPLEFTINRSYDEETYTL
jgi:hypothetical protein